MKNKIFTTVLIVIFTISLAAQKPPAEPVFKNAIRFQFLGPVKSVLGLEYERTIYQRMAIIAEAGYIGLNDSKVIDANAEGAIGGIGLKVYSKNYQIRREQNPKSSILCGIYGTARIGLESYSVSNIGTWYNVSTGLIYTDIRSFKRDVGSLMFGVGANFNVLKNFTIDCGFIGGVTFLNDINDSRNLFENGSYLRPYHHGTSFSGAVLPYTTRFYINIGMNF
jgi:hypothetical protein